MQQPVQTKTKIALAYGDGIGPEIMQATLRILDAAGAPLEYVPLHVGEKVYLEGHTSGLEPSAWDVLKETGVFLKAPITTPQGGGYKSLNVTIRKTLGLFANVRPTRSLHPFIYTQFPSLDVVIIRENEEDLYAGVEHQQTRDVVQCLKLVSRPGCERIVRYAFEHARSTGRKRVTCMTKDNIMKQTDGMFHEVFNEIGREYPDIEQNHYIIDIGTALLAADPGRFDVIVTLNLYGDIISDVVSQVAGSVGLSGSANIGRKMAMFEAIHGSAPDIAGRDIANPSGLLNAAVMMLEHVGMHAVAAHITNAWLATIEDGVHTADIYQDGMSRVKVGTQAFADAVIERLGRKPRLLASSDPLQNRPPLTLPEYVPKPSVKQLVGVDTFLDWQGDDPAALGQRLEQLQPEGLRLKMITNRGVKVYPDGNPETFCTNHWRCRWVNAAYHPDQGGYDPVEPTEVLGLLTRLHDAGLEVIKTENLYLFDGKRGFSLGQGE